MNIFLTGASGFIGRHVAVRLAQQGHTQRADLPWDVGIHLAWYVEPGKYLESPLNDQCRDESVALVKSTPCRRWVVAGTCFETAPKLSRYARCKRELCERLQSLDIALAWARLFFLYGPHEHPRRLVPYVINGLLRGEPVPLTPGEQVRDYLHVEDVAAALVALAEGQATGIVEVGSAQPVTVREIALDIAGLIGRPDLLKFGAQPYGPDEVMRLVADNSPVHPTISLTDGLRSTIEWWRQHPPTTPAR